MSRLWSASLAVLSAVLIAGCTTGPEGDSPSSPPLAASNQPSLGQPPGTGNRRLVYIQTWDDSATYARISALPLANNVDLAVSFAGPTADGGLTPPSIPDGLRSLVSQLDPNAGIMLAVGGWGGTDEDHQIILQGFAAAAADPDGFAGEVAQAAAQTGAALGRKITGIDIDWEYPIESQAQGFAAVTGAIKKAMPGVHLTAAVPSNHDLQGFADALPEVRNTVDGFHVMTYDEHTPFDGVGSTAGPVATTQGMLTAFQQWQQRLTAAGIDPTKADMGIPTYCYEYTGVQAAGQPSQGGAEVPYTQVEGQGLQPQPDGSSAAVVDGAWTTCLTPEDAQHVTDAAPTGTDVFYWSAEGLTPPYLTIGH
jgi:GH18 family chitinase